MPPFAFHFDHLYHQDSELSRKRCYRLHVTAFNDSSASTTCDVIGLNSQEQLRQLNWPEEACKSS